MTDPYQEFRAKGVNAARVDDTFGVIAHGRADEVLAVLMTRPLAEAVVMDILRHGDAGAPASAGTQSAPTPRLRAAVDAGVPAYAPRCDELGFSLLDDGETLVLHLRFGDLVIPVRLQRQAATQIRESLARYETILSTGTGTRQ